MLTTATHCGALGVNTTGLVVPLGFFSTHQLYAFGSDRALNAPDCLTQSCTSENAIVSTGFTGCGPARLSTIKR